MKRKPVVFFILTLCLVVAMITVGCGTDNDAEPAAGSSGVSSAATPPESGSGSSAPDDQDISGNLTLTIVESNKAGMEILLADFAAAYPNIVIEPEYVSDLNAYYTAIPTRMAAGNGPDLLWMVSGSASPAGITRFANAGYLADLSDQPWAANMYEATKSLFLLDDKVIAMDYGFVTLATMMYNKDYFEQNNLNVPTTFDELVELCKQINAIDDGVFPISWGAGDATVNHNDVTSIAANNVFSKDPEWLQKRLAGETTFAETEGWRTTLEQLKTLIDAGAFSPGAAGVNFSQMASEFGDGKAAMAFTTGQLSGMAMGVDPDLNIGQFTFPAADPADTRMVLTASGGIGINVESQNQEAAKVFLNFWSQPEEAGKYAVASSIIPSSAINEGKPDTTYVELEPMFAEGKVIADYTANWPNTSFKAEAGSSIQGLFTGQKTIDQILADMDTFFEAE